MLSISNLVFSMPVIRVVFSGVVTDQSVLPAELCPHIMEFIQFSVCHSSGGKSFWMPVIRVVFSGVVTDQSVLPSELRPHDFAGFIQFGLPFGCP